MGQALPIYTLPSNNANETHVVTLTPPTSGQIAAGNVTIRVARIDLGATNNANKQWTIARNDGSNVTDAIQPGDDLIYDYATNNRWVLRERPAPTVLRAPKTGIAGIDANDVAPIGAGTRKPPLALPPAQYQKTFQSLSDVRTYSTGSGTKTFRADPTPYNANGNPQMICGPGGSFTVTAMMRDLPGKLDATAANGQIISVISKLAGGITNIRRVCLDLSSDGWAQRTNLHRVNLPTNKLRVPAWMRTGAHVSQFAAQGTGADLTQINSVQLWVETNTSTGGPFMLSWADLRIHNNVNTRPKCTIWLDDSNSLHWTGAKQLLDRYGFPPPSPRSSARTTPCPSTHTAGCSSRVGRSPRTPTRSPSTPW